MVFPVGVAGPRTHMIRARSFSTLLLGVLFAAAVVGAQQAPAAQLPYHAPAPQSGPRPIHIDENCRIVPTSGDRTLRKKEHPYRDSAICHLESVLDSTHWEERIVGNQLQRTFVRVKEHTFVLQDIAGEPVMFVVSQAIPKDWAIDSDPQPADLTNDTAIFHVYVKPGQTVHLHVGMRREWLQKPKPI